METIWKILGASGLISVVVFMQVLSCVFFRKNNTCPDTNDTCPDFNNTCTHHSNVHTPPPRGPTAPPARVALMPGCC